MRRRPRRVALPHVICTVQGVARIMDTLEDIAGRREAQQSSMPPKNRQGERPSVVCPSVEKRDKNNRTLSPTPHHHHHCPATHPNVANRPLTPPPRHRRSPKRQCWRVGRYGHVKDARHGAARAAGSPRQHPAHPLHGVAPLVARVITPVSGARVRLGRARAGCAAGDRDDHAPGGRLGAARAAAGEGHPRHDRRRRVARR